jgi:hypothetical protein
MGFDLVHAAGKTGNLYGHYSGGAGILEVAEKMIPGRLGHTFFPGVICLPEHLPLVMFFSRL